MRREGVSSVEILIALVLGAIISVAMTVLFLGSNRAFMSNRQVAELSEDVRNAITTLEFLFSRWGAGVPCKNNNCTIADTITSCDGFPPSDPQCLTIKNEGKEAEFYANLFGYGFVTETYPNGTAEAISCRLVRRNTENCYYLWENGAVRNIGSPIQLNLSADNVDCIRDPDTAKITISSPDNVTFSNGTFISRVPHKIRLYVDNGILYMDREDTTSKCNNNEIAVRIGKVDYFKIEIKGRTVFLNATFINKKGLRFPLLKAYGR